MPSQNMKSLSRRLAGSGLVISFVLGVVLGAITISREFSRSYSAALVNTDRMLQSALPQLESAYWDLDLVSVQATLSRLLETPLIEKLEVRDLVLTLEQLEGAGIPKLSAQSEDLVQLWPILDWWIAQEARKSSQTFDLTSPRSGQLIARLDVVYNFNALYQDLARNALTIFSIAIAQALAIGAVMFLMIQRFVIRPVHGLSLAALDLRRGGQFTLPPALSQRLKTTNLRGEDEIHSLARDFFLTVQQLERYRDRLREEVEARTAELVVARNDALAASRAKSAFLANMSHELRTPLHAITGLTELLQAERLSVTARRHLTDMRGAARQLLGSIDNVLDISKLEAGQMRFDALPFRPEQILDEITSQIRAVIGQRPIALETDIAPDVPQLLIGDRQRVAQILLNLAANAAKFTTEGRIAIRLSQLSPGQFRFSVFDSGPGIAEADQQEIFFPFVQADDSTSRRFAGVGLGLPISRQMAESMGGSLRLVSRLGHGSLFVLSLPLGEAVAEPRTAVAPRPKVEIANPRLRRRIVRMLDRLPLGPLDGDILLHDATDTEGGLHLRGPARGEVLPQVLAHRELRTALQHMIEPISHDGSAHPQIDRLRLRERRVLLIEDRAINREVVQQLLESAGVVVQSAESGEVALTLLQDFRPDLILTDLHMPGMDGFACLSAIKAAGLGAIAVVASSADVSTETRAMCEQAGFAGFLPKPITAEALMDELVEVLAQRQPVIDQQTLLQNAAGNQDLAQRWLAMLPKEIADWREGLTAPERAKAMLHIIRGTSAQLGASEIFALASEDPHDLARLSAGFDRLEAAVRAHDLGPASGATPRLELDIAALISSLEDHNMRAFDQLEAALDHLPTSVVTPLRAAVDTLDFQAAATELRKIAPPELTPA